ncbi:MAG: competence/damage-inducible protein A [Rhodoblastus sp.]
MSEKTEITAAVLVIGDEILSGRTKDKNIGYIADYLMQIAIDLREVRIVPDVEAEIVDALNALRARYTYVFTTGGIGPTHDDITADSVAKAFGVDISEHPRAIELLLTRIKPEDLNAARRRMARIPHGAELVENRVSTAPGFMIGNVVVMAGVPSIMQAMLDNVTPRLKTGVKMLMDTIQADNVPEGAYAAGLGEIAAKYPEASIGSYPSFASGKFQNQIVVRSKKPDVLAAALGEARELIARLAAARAKS